MTSNQKNIQSIHPKYRPDIDGLRAIAVLSVVGFHAFPDWVQGGFIGVDIFFVISGYLISTIIIENLSQGCFSFVDFYYRRTSRIFPALIAVLTSCVLFGWFFFTPIEFSQLGKHISSGAGFVSNFTLWRESGYFDAGSAKKVLLHLWSLGIEEQFYLLWPVLVWVAYKIRLNLLIVILISLVASFSLNVTSIDRDPISVFYHPGTRVWELLIGAALAYINIKQSTFFVKLQKHHSNLLSICGIFLISIGFVFLNKDSQFPGWWALLPTLGAAFVIAAKPTSWMSRYILGQKLVVWFGLISFPLYLWHWPLLSISQTIYTVILPPLFVRLALIFLSVGLAWATYSCIEKPLRKIENSYKKFASLIMLMAIIGIFGCAIFKLDGLPTRFNRDALKIRFGENICHSADGSAGIPCQFGNLNSDKTILIYGDSISGHLTNALIESLGSKYKFVFFGHTSCFLKKYDGSQHCETLRNELYKYRDKNVFAVIRSHSLSRYGATDKREIKEYLLSAVAEAETLHPQKIIISGDVQNIDADCEFANYYIPSRKKECGFDRHSSDLNQTFFKVSKELTFPKNVFFIYPYEKLCDGKSCQIINDSTSYYYNGQHLSTDGALLLIPDIVNILGNQ
jgi:peptidoglycan/LPS O-acetylase OafA/YrhL